VLLREKVTTCVEKKDQQQQLIIRKEVLLDHHGGKTYRHEEVIPQTAAYKGEISRKKRGKGTTHSFENEDEVFRASGDSSRSEFGTKGKNWRATRKKKRKTRTPFGIGSLRCPKCKTPHGGGGKSWEKKVSAVGGRFIQKGNRTVSTKDTKEAIKEEGTPAKKKKLIHPESRGGSNAP